MVGAGVVAQGQERPADDVRQERLPHLAALTQDRQLHAIVAAQHVQPRSGDRFGDTQPPGVDDLKQHAVSLGWGGPDQEADLPSRH